MRVRAFCAKGNREIGPMGMVHQLACASLAAAFSLAMLVTAHLFMEYRSSHDQAAPIARSIQYPI